jgi:hypothetical protein
MRQTQPSPYFVCVRLPKTKYSDPDKLYRVGHALDLAGCRTLIQEDLKSMNDTLGGLIEAVSTKGREYHVFKAIWEEVSCK